MINGTYGSFFINKKVLDSIFRDPITNLKNYKEQLNEINYQKEQALMIFNSTENQDEPSPERIGVSSKRCIEIGIEDLTPTFSMKVNKNNVPMNFTVKSKKNISKEKNLRNPFQKVLKSQQIVEGKK